MGVGCSRRNHHGNRRTNDRGQQLQVPPPYHYPLPYPAPRGMSRDGAPFPPYPPFPPVRDPLTDLSRGLVAQHGSGMRQYGQARQQMPPTHGQHHPQQTHGTIPSSECHQTKTIRNRVNLKKATLEMAPLEGEENKLVPRFVFDASAPCSATVFYMAQEEPAAKSKLTTIMQEPGPRALYSTGLGQVFPPEGKEMDYALDLNAYQQDDLTSVKGDVTFPLVIRLETVADASGEGHTLESLEPGCPTPTWVQSQTTYAYLVKDGESWEPRTVKQKIWVDGISYELQEIYGIQEFYTGDKKADKDKIDTYTEDIEGRECVICLAALRDTTVLPCRHMCMCAECARELQRQQVSNCPICRDTIESLLHIKRPEKNHEPSEKATGIAQGVGSA